MSAKLAPFIKQQYFDSNGEPLSSGKVYTYTAGTTTPLATYTDQGGGTPNANPIILDANGEASVWLSDAYYKFVIKDSNDVTLRTIDNVTVTVDGAADAAASAIAAAASATAAATSASAAGTSATNAATSASSAATSATNAASSASAASTSATNASSSSTSAALSASNSSSSASTAATQASNASSSATNAAASAVAAAASDASAAAQLASAFYRDVVYKAFADSPQTITSGDNGKLFVYDSSGGAIAVTLPQISGTTPPFNVAFLIKTAGNAVTVSRAGTDTIMGSTSKAISTAGVGFQLIADTGASPDDWSSLDFGAVANASVTKDKLAAGAYSAAATAKTADYTLSSSDDVVLYDVSGASRVATLPTAVGISGKKYTIVNSVSTTNTLTINTTSSQTIGGRASGAIVFRRLGDRITVISDGTNWQIVEKLEHEVVTAGSSSYSYSSAGADGNFGQVTGNSVSLTYGRWRLRGTIFVNTGSGSGIFLYGTSGFYAANGANSSSTPTALGTTSGFLTSGAMNGSFGLLTSSTSNLRGVGLDIQSEISITGTTSVYLVPALGYSSAGSATLVAAIIAERIW